MNIHLGPKGADDPGFVSAINRVIADLIARTRPRDVFVVQVADPFGDRWCGTGGRFLGERQAQTVVSREIPTLPPFPPERILSEEAFRLALDFVTYVRNNDAEPLHVHGLKGKAYQRELSMFTEAGLFIWYSGGTGTGNRGTVMAQVVTPEYTDVWHASLVRTLSGWEFEQGIGIGREEFER
jgi:hypothetical protein